MKHVLIIGSLNMDVVVNMERLPLVGQTVLGSGFWNNPGGKGANQGCAIGKLGGSVTMLGCVGSDEYGEQLVENLKSVGVNTEDIRRVEEATGTAFIFADSDANNSIVTITGANSYCDLNFIEENRHLIQNSDYLLLQLEIPKEAVYYAIDIAHEYGKTIILNPAPAPIDIPGSILQKIDFLTPNETELATISGSKVETIEEMVTEGKKLIDRGVKNVIVTIGELGAVWIHKEGYELVRGIPVNAVDTTAAGDCFNGAFAVELANGQSIYNAIQKANVAAAISVTRKGAQISLPTRDELDHFDENDLFKV